jgi:hypothetical protein
MNLGPILLWCTSVALVCFPDKLDRSYLIGYVRKKNYLENFLLKVQEKILMSFLSNYIVLYSSLELIYNFFCNYAPGAQCYKTFYVRNLRMFVIS